MVPQIDAETLLQTEFEHFKMLSCKILNFFLVSWCVAILTGFRDNASVD